MDRGLSKAGQSTGGKPMSAAGLLTSLRSLRSSSPTAGRHRGPERARTGPQTGTGPQTHSRVVAELRPEHMSSPHRRPVGEKRDITMSVCLQWAGHVYVTDFFSLARSWSPPLNV